MLLSSLPGAAITSVKFSGILHEFTSIEGVVEDVTEIILNLKKVRMRVINKQTSKLELSLNGGGKFTAAELQKSCPDIEILNPEQHIATLNEDAKLVVFRVHEKGQPDRILVE